MIFLAIYILCFIFVDPSSHTHTHTLFQGCSKPHFNLTFPWGWSRRERVNSSSLFIVSIHRPPSTAQKATYTTVRSGATRPVHTTRYGKTREKSRRTECINVQQPTHHPVWKPFSSERSLSKDKNKQTNIKKSYSTVNSVSNTTNQDRDPDLAR